ncbi:MAG: hypothetical protein ABIF08_02385 [Nanoarchaeota archaeon]
MKTDHGKLLKDSLKFAVKPERWLPFFITDFLACTVALFYILFNAPAIVSLMNSTNGMAVLGGLVQSGLVLFTVFIVWILIRLWLQTSVVHQSYKEKQYNQSFKIGYKKLPSVLAAVIIIGFIGTLVSVIPFFGVILAILVGIMFFFAMQAIVVGNYGFYDAMMKSYKIFRKKPFEVIVAWFIISLVSFFITTAFAIPISTLFINVLISMVSQSGSMVSGALLSSYVVNLVQAYLPVVIITGIVALIGFAIANVFSLKAQTEYYLKMK